MGVSHTGVSTQLPQYSIISESKREKVHMTRVPTVNWRGRNESTIMFMAFTEALTGR